MWLPVTEKLEDSKTPELPLKLMYLGLKKIKANKQNPYTFVLRQMVTQSSQ